MGNIIHAAIHVRVAPLHQDAPYYTFEELMWPEQTRIYSRRVHPDDDVSTQASDTDEL